MAGLCDPLKPGLPICAAFRAVHNESSTAGSGVVLNFPSRGVVLRLGGLREMTTAANIMPLWADRSARRTGVSVGLQTHALRPAFRPGCPLVPRRSVWRRAAGENCDRRTRHL